MNVYASSGVFNSVDFLFLFFFFTFQVQKRNSLLLCSYFKIHTVILEEFGLVKLFLTNMYM